MKGKITMKTLLIVGIIASIIIAFVLYVPITGGDADDGAPTANITMQLEDVNGNLWEAVIDLEPMTTAEIFTSKSSTFRPASVHPVELVGIGYWDTYLVGFSVSSTVIPEDVNDTVGALKGACSISGTTPNPANGNGADTFFLFSNTPTNYLTSLNGNFQIGDQVDYNFLNRFDSMALANPGGGFQYFADPIYGGDLDNSTFIVDIEVRDVATNGLTHYGKTTATIILTVDPDGNLVVTVDDIQTIVS